VSAPFIHIARPVTTLNSDLTCCGKYLCDTDWVCFEGEAYSNVDCADCVKHAQHRRLASALARDKVAGMRGVQA
jgi:hypothetical protein